MNNDLFFYDIINYERKKNMIIGIIGPTGVGKTKMSIELAKKYKAIIINADAMQVYKDLNIGTAKIRAPFLLSNLIALMILDGSIFL